MILVDVHAHLDWKDFKDLDEVIERAKLAGVKAIISAGVDPKSNRQVLEIAKRYDIVKAALGIYPPDALGRETNTENLVDIDKEIEFITLNRSKIIAIGEIGLDYKSEDADKEMQKHVFVNQLRLAKKLNLPIIVHSRKAELEVIEILEKEGMKKVVLHCFSGKTSLIKKAICLGWSFSIPTNVVKSEQFQNLVKIVPLPQLLTETDSPFLSPFQGKRNEPAFVAESVKKIAEIKKLDQLEAANIIYSNYQNMFL